MNEYPTAAVGTKIVRAGVTFTMTEDGWRAELQHSMMRRCRNWDYSRPWCYLVTLGCQHHEVVPMPEGIPVKAGNVEVVQPIPSDWHLPQWLDDVYAKPGSPHMFGRLTGATAAEARIELNAFGRCVEEMIASIPATYPQVRILEHIVMPNHLHMVIRITAPLPAKTPLGIVLNNFKSWVNRRYKEVALGLPANTLMRVPQPSGAGRSATGVSCFQSSVSCFQSGTENTKLGPENTKPGPEKRGHGGKNPKRGLVFEPGFHDRILFREGQLQCMIDYCRDNPRRLWEVVNNRRYFETVEGLELSMPLLAAGGTAGHNRWTGPVTGLLAPVRYSQSQSTGSWYQTVTFSAIGNRSLLKVAERIQIQCSRSMTTEAVEARTQDVLDACQHGVVPISPCISPGEKSVARAVLDAGYSLIALLPQGIPPTHYKPYRQFFDACARGQLLLLSPWVFEGGVSHVKRWQCLFMNDLAAQLVVIETTTNKETTISSSR